MERLNELLENKMLSLEELDEIEEMEGVTTEDNGMSGSHHGWHWYTVNCNDESYDIYVK